MADGKHEQQKEFAFVTEQIVKRSGKKRWIKKVLGAMALAVVFGATAGVTFALVLPFVRARMPKEEETTREAITIPRDEPATTGAVQTETPAETDTMPVTTPAETETTRPVEDIVENVLAERGITLEDYTSIYNAMYEVVAQVNKSIVTVTSAESKMDLFNQPYEIKDETSGLIYNKTGSEILILTDMDGIHSADNIWVTFLDGTECEAVLRRADTVSGLAVLAIDISSSEADFGEFPVAVLGNSYTVKPGDIAITVGNPFGYNYSMSYGIISSVKNSARAVDINYRVINTNILEGATGRGFLINTKGEVTGVITKTFKNENTEGITTAIAISDLKGTLERLSNGEEILYFGIIGQDVTSEVEKELGLPKGIYVSEAVVGSPVYQAGVQSGDVIVEFDSTEVHTMKAFRNLLENHKSGDVISVTVMRKGREGYKSIEFEVELGVQ